MGPEDLSKVVEYVRSIRSDNEPFDVASVGWTTAVNRERNAKKVSPFAEAGMTWWLENLYPKRDSPEGIRKRIHLGPPSMS